MENNNTLKLSDDMIYSPKGDTCSIWIPKKIATIKLCGSLEFFIYENTSNWVQPTPEQIDNLKKLLVLKLFWKIDIETAIFSKVAVFLSLIPYYII